jgi:hypothetical protein
MHVADVAWAWKLISMGRLNATDEDNVGAITVATAKLLDDLKVADIYAKT